MCTSSYIRKKLMKKVRRQPNMKLKDIQDVVHEKLTLNITPGKVGRAREKAREYVDEAHTQQYNKLWEYCEELKRASPGNTILMKVHTFNEGDLATEMDLDTIKEVARVRLEETLPYQEPLLELVQPIRPADVETIPTTISQQDKLKLKLNHPICTTSAICIIPVHRAYLHS
nr:hypothetical protein CFP56_76469 [Quercus suber]